MGLWDYFLSSSPGHVEIKNDVWVAGYVSILDGITIGNGAILGANSVVTKDVPPYAFVAGNPAEIKKYRFSQGVIDKLLAIQWWDWTDEQIGQRINDFKNIDTFVERWGKV
jgi:serine acetyltransferase